MKRLFIAVDIKFSEETKKIIYDIFQQLSPALRAKWVNPDNAHITLKFLGDTDENKIETIASLLKNVAEENQCCDIEITRLGVFKNMKSPSVLWIGVSNGEALKQLSEKINDLLEKACIEKETKPFRAHLTIGRIKQVNNFDTLKKIIEKYQDFVFGKIKISGFHLYESALTPKWPIYHRLYSFPLKD
ncbi:MAG: RNA 2',3'-cyclic phosphodiesterase [Bacteroidia bacterium]|nr:RNA 2',3'-cyclic phosphodiesterase [Bacteroidia bacterium]